MNPLRWLRGLGSFHYAVWACFVMTSTKLGSGPARQMVFLGLEGVRREREQEGEWMVGWEGRPPAPGVRLMPGQAGLSVCLRSTGPT